MVRGTWPNIYAFGYAGKPFKWFAWHPVRLWYGKWVFWQTVTKCKITKHGFLDGPHWTFWTYDD